MSAPIFTRLLSPFRHAVVFGAAVASLSAAQTQPPPAVPTQPPTAADSGIRVVLLTVGQGAQVYELFGHNAIWVHDPATRTNAVYNWGVFDFRAAGFIPRFLRGEMRYTMDVWDIQNTLAYYQSQNRRVWAQELDLTASEKRALVDFVRWNALEENRRYRYNYYLDNCSTRVRDVLDRVLGGRLRQYLRSVPTDETYRSHSLRLMQSQPLLATGVDVALGRPTDFKLSADEASFLPVQFMEHLRNFKRADGRPIVTREYVIGESTRGPEPTTVPALWKPYLLIGVVLAALLLGLALGLHARIPAAVLVAVFAGIVGIVGTIMVLLVTVTDHVAAHGNENLWMLNPLWFVVAVVLARMLVKRRPSAFARRVTIAAAVIAAGAVVMHLVGLSRQPNWDVIGLLLPTQLAMGAIALRYRPVSDVGSAKNST